MAEDGDSSGRRYPSTRKSSLPQPRRFSFRDCLILNSDLSRTDPSSESSINAQTDPPAGTQSVSEMSQFRFLGTRSQRLRPVHKISLGTGSSNWERTCLLSQNRCV